MAYKKNAVSTDGTQTLINKTLTSPKINEDVALTATATELNYVDGVTSAIQTQLDAKGTGNVSKVGTPANNQIGVWTGDGTIEGDASLTYDGTSLNLATAKNFQIAGSTVLADAAGTTTLSNIDAIDATTESTIESAIDTLANLSSIQGRTVTLADAGANAIFGWDDVAGAYENLTQAEARTVLGLGTAALVATDLADLNEATIETAIDTLANLTSIQGRTVTLADAGADAILGWDDSVSAYENLTQAEVLAVIGDSSATAKGVVELAIDSEAVTGTDTARAVTPANLTARLAAPGTIGGTTPAAATFTTVSVNDDAYGAGWNGSANVPTKNAVYDKIETLSSSSALTFIPYPNLPVATGASTQTTFSTNTTMSLYQFIIPCNIVVNKISMKSGGTVTTSGTWDITIYSEDGQTQEIAVTTASVSTGDTIVSTAVSAVTLRAGVHYFAINPNGTANSQWYCYTQGANAALGLTAGLLGDVSSEPVIAGTLTITAGTPAVTFTPSAITENTLNNVGVVFRLDN